jgi:predicted RNA-binding Zn-ribbon protein involved in translation (DUF1610 family)
MVTDHNLFRRRLEHFHVCTHCGIALRREEYIGRGITSGVYRCPKCGMEGPLNVEIREIEEAERANHELC